jgi:hypothetical protein
MAIFFVIKGWAAGVKKLKESTSRAHFPGDSNDIFMKKSPTTVPAMRNRARPAKVPASFLRGIVGSWRKQFWGSSVLIPQGKP